MSGYVPTTEEVQAVWQERFGDGDAGYAKTLRRDGEEQFDRWLAALIREAKAEALEEAADLAEGVECIVLDPVMEKISKYVGLSLAQEFRARAAEYRKAVGK